MITRAAFRLMSRFKTVDAKVALLLFGAVTSCGRTENLERPNQLKGVADLVLTSSTGERFEGGLVLVVASPASSSIPELVEIGGDAASATRQLSFGVQLAPMKFLVKEVNADVGQGLWGSGLGLVEIGAPGSTRAASSGTLRLRLDKGALSGTIVADGESYTVSGRYTLGCCSHELPQGGGEAPHGGGMPCGQDLEFKSSFCSQFADYREAN